MRRVNARVNLKPPNQRNLEIEMQPLLRRRGKVQTEGRPDSRQRINGAVGEVWQQWCRRYSVCLRSGTFMMAVGAVVIVAASAFLIPNLKPS
jgi:hypothetical protein